MLTFSVHSPFGFPTVLPFSAAALDPFFLIEGIRGEETEPRTSCLQVARDHSPPQFHSNFPHSPNLWLHKAVRLDNLYGPGLLKRCGGHSTVCHAWCNDGCSSKAPVRIIALVAGPWTTASTSVGSCGQSTHGIWRRGATCGFGSRGLPRRPRNSAVCL